LFYNTYMQDISRNLLRNDLEAKDLPNVMEVANQLGVKPEEALVVIAIVYQLKTKSLVKEHNLVELLLPFQCGKQTRLSVRELTDYINVHHQEGNRNLYLQDAFQNALDLNDLSKMSNAPDSLMDILSFWKATYLSYDSISVYQIEKGLKLFSFLPEMSLSRYLDEKLHDIVESFVLISTIVANVENSGESLELNYLNRWIGFSSKDLQIIKNKCISKANPFLPIADGYLELENSSVIDINNLNLRLTQKGVQYFLQGNVPNEIIDNLLNGFKATSLSVIQHEEIETVDLVFDAQFQEQLNTIEKLLVPSNFSQYKAKFNRSFNVLVSGASGTGKTTWVRQLSKQTRKNLIFVKSAEIIDPYVGVSVQKLQSIFSAYEKLNRSSESILVFDEADSLLGARTSSGSGGAERMLNDLTNAFLQHLEQHNGVVFILTNHPESLDIAFARRFSFKIEFPKPRIEQQKEYWHKAMPELDEEIIHLICNKFDMSIATIEKIISQFFIQTLVSSAFKAEKKESILLNLCQNEVAHKTLNPIGFNIQNTKNTQYALQSSLPK
jgi:AAA+ superfamily predicted ATPase